MERQLSAHDGSLNPLRDDIRSLQEMRRKDKEEIRMLKTKIGKLEDFVKMITVRKGLTEYKYVPDSQEERIDG